MLTVRLKIDFKEFMIRKLMVVSFCAVAPMFFCFDANAKKSKSGKSPIAEVKKSVANNSPSNGELEKNADKPVIVSKDEASSKQPKIVVFTSKGGNGHMSACATLKDVFPNCEIKLINPIYDFFQSYFDGEAWYNSLFQNGWIGTANLMVKYPGKTFLKMRSKTFKKRFLQFLDEEKPDMLISVIPLINYPAAWAAQQRSIPFMIITLDADLDLWLLNMERCSNHNFTMTVQAKTPRIEKQLAKKHIPVSCIREVGAPLRKEFSQPKDKLAIRKEWNIPDDKKVLLLMRGGTGSIKLVDYVKSLVKLDKSLHLLVCVGRNEALIPKLKRIKSNGQVSFSIVPFTNKIHDLMAVSDLLVSQPSPNVCNEAMHMKLPILVDMSGKRMYWEDATVDWLKLRGCGQIFKRMRHLNKMVVKCLEEGPAAYAQNAKPFLHFETEIHSVVSSLLPSVNGSVSASSATSATTTA